MSGQARPPDDILSAIDQLYKRLYILETHGTKATTFAGCRVKRTSSVSPGVGTYQIAFDVEDFDTNGYHSTVTNNRRITVPAGYAGYYFVHANVHVSSKSVNARYHLYLKKNGVTYIGASLTDDTNVTGLLPYLTVDAVAYLSVGDYIEAEVNAAAGTFTVYGDANPWTMMEAVYLGV